MYFLTMKDLNKYKTVTEVIEGYLRVKEAGEILTENDLGVQRYFKLF